MQIGLGKRRCVFLAAVVPAVLALPPPALAENADPREIVVTARRFDEAAHDVPLNVAVVVSSEIGPGSVDGLQSLAARVPGLSFEGFAGAGAPLGATTPILRGQSQPSAFGDAVAIFVDGVYQANRDAIDLDPLDMARIEVVYGPQSALYGHSSFAGLIAYVPAAPTEKPFASGTVGVGTDYQREIRATLSGPIGRAFKARLAASWKSADGAWSNAAAPGRHLGNFRKLALAGTIATRDDGGIFSLRLSGRYGETRAGHPPLFTLGGSQFNCGARDPVSGLWSSFCGAVPIPRQLAISSGVPASATRGGQLALRLRLDLGVVELRSDSSFYQAEADTYRDHDGYPGGELFGVCAVGVNCSGLGSLVDPVLRLQSSERVVRNLRSGREFAHELRLSHVGSRFGWQLGAVAIWSRARNRGAFGAARGVLAAHERFTSLVFGDPMRVGPLSYINNALVDDPQSSQVLENDSVEHRRTMALFATADWRLGERLRLRGEARANWERLTRASRRASFRPSFGTTLGTRHYFDLTPRVSLDWRPREEWLAYASYARGSRSGGINAQPGLIPEEQTFAPETNWTAEVGVKYAGRGVIRSVQATGYHIDWRNTQILGFSVTPGVGGLITHNIEGVETWGLELAAQLAPASWLALDLAYGYANPRYKPGSEDPGSSLACGLSATSTTSSFCRIVLSRVLPGQLVPDVSGNRPQRAPKVNWSAGATVAPASGVMSGMRLRLDLSHQGNVFERSINGGYYGARTLLNARLAIPIGAISTEVWGTNLTDERYILISPGGRPNPIYAGQPRPIDFAPGERRRIGLTLRYPR